MKIIILMLAMSASDADCENARPFWAFESADDCQIVADALNRNGDTYLFCIAAQPDREV